MMYDVASLTPRDTFTLSGETVGQNKYSAGYTPLVIDGTEGYLLETGGPLRSYDLALAHEAWSAPVISSFLENPPVPFLLTDCLVVADGDASGEIRGYARADGASLWTIVPVAPPYDRGGCVLEDELILAPLVNGEIYALDSSGTLFGPVHTEESLYAGGSYLGVVAANEVFLVSTDDEVICFETTSPLALGVQPDPVSAGQTLDFHARGGSPDATSLLAVTAVNTLPVFIAVLSTRLDSQGQWSRGFPVPNGPNGIDVTFQFFSAAQPSGVHVSNERTVHFQ